MTKDLQFVTVSASDKSLFHLAARFYGDATQWLLIAKANGLSGPIITGLMTLRIPPADPKAGGGIGNQ